MQFLCIYQTTPQSHILQLQCAYWVSSILRIGTKTVCAWGFWFYQPSQYPWPHCIATPVLCFCFASALTSASKHIISYHTMHPEPERSGSIGFARIRENLFLFPDNSLGQFNWACKLSGGLIWPSICQILIYMYLVKYGHAIIAF